MIKQTLENFHKIGKLNHTYLINTDDNNKALKEIELFLSDNIFKCSDIKKSVDYYCIKREDSKVNNISINQIRDLQNFLYKTSMISGKKASIIYAADEMNLNASNSCLKILEEPPANSYLFLISQNITTILPTIRSRCTKINHYYHLTETVNIDELYILPLLKNTQLSDKLNFIKKFASKDRDIWHNFTNAIEHILTKMMKSRISNKIILTKIETELLEQLKDPSPLYLSQKYDEIIKIIKQTNQFDLDLRVNIILLIEKMRY